MQAALGLKADRKGLVPGVRYHQFDRVPTYEGYLRRLDAVLVTDGMRAEMVEEARVAFGLNISLNAEFTKKRMTRAML